MVLRKKNKHTYAHTHKRTRLKNNLRCYCAGGKNYTAPPMLREDNSLTKPAGCSLSCGAKTWNCHLQRYAYLCVQNYWANYTSTMHWVGLVSAACTWGCWLSVSVTYIGCVLYALKLMSDAFAGKCGIQNCDTTFNFLLGLRRFFVIGT